MMVESQNKSLVRLFLDETPLLERQKGDKSLSKNAIGLGWMQKNILESKWVLLLSGSIYSLIHSQVFFEGQGIIERVMDLEKEFFCIKSVYS